MTPRLFAIIILSLIASALAYGIFSHSDDLLFDWIFRTPWLLCLAIWNLYALLDARREALYFTMKSKTTSLDEFSDHPFFFAQRALVLILMLFILQTAYPLTDFGLQKFYPIVLLAGMFPFVHDGMYYRMRDQLDGSYTRRFFSKPKKPTSVFDIVYKYPIVRTVSFLLSLGLYLYLYIHG